jgi:hypothetical protein
MDSSLERIRAKIAELEVKLANLRMPGALAGASMCGARTGKMMA